MDFASQPIALLGHSRGADLLVERLQLPVCHAQLVVEILSVLPNPFLAHYGQTQNDRDRVRREEEGKVIREIAQIGRPGTRQDVDAVGDPDQQAASSPDRSPNKRIARPTGRR